METLPQDIMFDVLSRLPAKSIVRFRRVCKSWFSLISKPEFVKTHLNRAITEDVSVGGCRRLLIPNYIWESDSRSLESIDYEALQLLSEQKLKEARQNKGGNACTVLEFPYSDPKRRIRLVGYCHGMVGMEVDMDKIVLCNPCTREFRELPKPSSLIIPDSRIRGAGGLGYDSSVDDYKFVIAVGVKDDDESNHRIKAEVFSLRSNSWRMLHDIGRDISCFQVNGSGIFLNGALHWIACCETGEIIISFDMATEKFQEPFPVPPDLSYYKKLIVLGGYLSVSCRGIPRSEVWVMKEYGVEASWTKLYTVNLHFNMSHFRPLCFSNNGELLVDVDCQIRIYNPKEKNSRKLYEGNWYCQNLIVYIESLVSPYGYGGKKK